MSRWLRERQRDPFYRKAKREGYRSRASYKLLEIDARFELFQVGARVVDLGAAPGGWTQVALERVGNTGTVVGVDLDAIHPLEGAIFLKGDMTDPATVAATLAEAGGEADVVISDMSPNISGIYVTDQARSVHLANHAVDFARQVLRPGGSFVAKVFEGDLFPEFLVFARKHFRAVKVTSPRASRDASSEVYVVGKGFIPSERTPPKVVGWEEGSVIGDDAPLRKRVSRAAESTPAPDDSA